MGDIVIKNLNKAFDGKPVLRNLSLRIPSGRCFAIMAPSGYGKTTLLRILMGFERADSGSVDGLEGQRLSAVFQEDRLCEHLSALQNIRLVGPELPRDAMVGALRNVGLADCCDQPVRELSGGMRRRAALVRALMAQYDVLILDEPFKGLDEETKALVIRETRERIAGKTAVMVTHDPKEAEAMGAEVVALESASDVQPGERPAE